MSKLKDIVGMPWVLISCGFWMALAFIRGQKIKYRQWRIRRLDEKISLTHKMKRELDKRIKRSM